MIIFLFFSVTFAYVADVTDENGRSLGYGLVTAGFAASLIISPALGAGLELYFENENIVVILATVVALLDVVFIILIVPESLPSSQKLGIKTLTFKQVRCCFLSSLFIHLFFRLIHLLPCVVFGQTGRCW